MVDGIGEGDTLNTTGTQHADYVAPTNVYFQTLQQRLYQECVTANWDPGHRNTFAEECAHLHEEVTEAFKWWRLHQDFEVTIDADGRPHGVPIELADVLIGLFYLAELHGFDLLAAVELKHRFNLTRDYAAEGRQLHARPALTDGAEHG